MSSERADQPAAPDHQHRIPGQTLAAQREAMGWSVEQVADQLKLAVRQVVALEAGDYASLPSPAVTRGFVRAYAKLMRLDPVPLVAQIEMDTPAPADTSAATAARRPSPTSFSQSKFPSHGKRSALPLGWIAGAVVVVAAAAGAWHFGLIPLGQHGDGNSVAAPATPAVSAAVTEAPDGHAVETLQSPSVPLISVPSPTGEAASAPATAPAQAAGPVVNVPATTATGAPPATVPAAPATPAATLGNVAGATPAAAPAVAGANALVLNVRDDSWIEVRPAKGGNALISRLVKGGSTETVNVDQPVRVTVGNPGGVTATLRGAAVALPAVPGKTIARVNLQ
jgi:cytoskeleton protein RodZ